MKALWFTAGLLLAASEAAAQAPDGKALYEKRCGMCHGADGVPPAAMVKMMPALRTLDSAFLASRSEDSVVKVLIGGTPSMSSYREKLTPEEMAAVAKYTRELAMKKKEGGPDAHLPGS